MTLIDKKLNLALPLHDKSGVRKDLLAVLNMMHDVILSLLFFSAAPKGPKLFMSPTRAKVGDTVRIAVQGFQVRGVWVECKVTKFGVG